MFSDQHIRVAEFCAEEVKRQMDGPLEVFGMLDAWRYAQDRFREHEERTAWGQLDYSPNFPSLTDVKEIGRRVLQTKMPGSEFRYAQPRPHHLLGSGYMADNGWRAVPVSIGDRRGTNPASIDYAMDEWLAALYYDRPRMMNDLARRRATEQGILERFKVLEPDFAACAYFSFEHVHPFPDGNGRSGKIVYNWIRGTLDEPEFPPNFWRIDNP